MVGPATLTPPSRLLQAPCITGRQLGASSTTQNTEESFPRKRLLCHFRASPSTDQCRGRHQSRHGLCGGLTDLNLKWGLQRCSEQPTSRPPPGAFITEEPGSPQPSPSLACLSSGSAPGCEVGPLTCPGPHTGVTVLIGSQDSAVLWHPSWLNFTHDTVMIFQNEE